MSLNKAHHQYSQNVNSKKAGATAAVAAAIEPEGC